MKFTAEQIAQVLSGEIDGNSKVEVNNISKIEEGTPGTLSFLANPKYAEFIYSTNASIVLVRKDFVPREKINSTLIKVEDPYQAFATLLALYEQAKGTKVGISPNAFIDKTAKTGKEVYIAEFVYIGKNCEIGNNVKLYPSC